MGLFASYVGQTERFVLLPQRINCFFPLAIAPIVAEDDGFAIEEIRDGDLVGHDVCGVERWWRRKVKKRLSCLYPSGHHVTTNAAEAPEGETPN